MSTIDSFEQQQFHDRQEFVENDGSWRGTFERSRRLIYLTGAPLIYSASINSRRLIIRYIQTINNDETTVNVEYNYTVNGGRPQDLRNLIISLEEYFWNASSKGILMTLLDVLGNRHTASFLFNNEIYNINLNERFIPYVALGEISHMILRIKARPQQLRRSEAIFGPLRSRSTLLTLSSNIRLNNNFITFGKYKGHTYRYVIRHDKDYCNWVLNTAKDKDSSEELREFARYIRN